MANPVCGRTTKQQKIEAATKKMLDWAKIHCLERSRIYDGSELMLLAIKNYIASVVQSSLTLGNNNINDLPENVCEELDQGRVGSCRVKNMAYPKVIFLLFILFDNLKVTL